MKFISFSFIAVLLFSTATAQLKVTVKCPETLPAKTNIQSRDDFMMPGFKYDTKSRIIYAIILSLILSQLSKAT